MDYGPQAPLNTASHISTAQVGVSHARCCLLVLVRCSVVGLCSLPVACRLPGTCLGCVFVKGKKAGDILLIRTYKTRPLALKPGKSYDPLPPNKTLWAWHTLQSTDRAWTSTNVFDRASRVDFLGFRQKVLVGTRKISRTQLLVSHVGLVFFSFLVKIIF